jgi:hypothetical protein
MVTNNTKEMVTNKNKAKFLHQLMYNWVVLKTILNLH